ncbi:MAG: prenyltransferase/squalene oxidase repeat-containing protein [Planctomycetota bacterium]
MESGWKTPCSSGVDVVAYLQGQLDPSQTRSFRLHLERCDECAGLVEECRPVLLAVAREPVPRRPVDLLPKVLAAVSAAERSPVRLRAAPFAGRLRRVAVLLFSAGLVGLIAGVVWRRPESPMPATSRSEGGVSLAADPERTAWTQPDNVRAAETLGLEWLAAAQEASGGWSASRWGGDARHDLALTALATLAFTNPLPASPATDSNEVEAATESRPLAVARALDYLVSRQTAAGRFGDLPNGEGLYNHVMATLALLESFARGYDEGLRAPIEKALDYLVGAQATDGGWGGSPTQSALLAGWSHQALLLGHALGCADLAGPIARSNEYLAQCSADGARAAASGPINGSARSSAFARSDLRSLVAAFRGLLSDPDEPRAPLFDAVDHASKARVWGQNLYEDLLWVSALNVHPEQSGASSASEGCVALADQQVRAGEYEGSWEPSDPWSLAGGRVYSTVTATLVLQGDRRMRTLGQWIRGT